jgi:Immunity protein 27
MLKPHETDLIGEWQLVGGKVVGNEACRRIDLLTSQYLEHIATDPSGWNNLYRDPKDGRYWERIYPQSGWHGGGPPRLTCLSREEVQIKYGL